MFNPINYFQPNPNALVIPPMFFNQPQQSFFFPQAAVAAAATAQTQTQSQQQNQQQQQQQQQTRFNATAAATTSQNELRAFFEAQQQQQQQFLQQQQQMFAYPALLNQLTLQQQQQICAQMMPLAQLPLQMAQNQLQFNPQQMMQMQMQLQSQNAMQCGDDKSNIILIPAKCNNNLVNQQCQSLTEVASPETITSPKTKSHSYLLADQLTASTLSSKKKIFSTTAATAAQMPSASACKVSYGSSSKLQAKRLKQRLLDESSEQQRALLVQVQQVSKQNSAKAFLKAYRKFALQQSTHLYAYEIYENKYYYKLCQDMPIVRVDNPNKKDIDGFHRKFKKFFNGKQFNNNTLKNVIRNKLYGKLFDDFLRYHSMDWLRQSKTKNKEDLSVLIRFLLICYDNNDYLVFLRDHEKAAKDKLFNSMANNGMIPANSNVNNINNQCDIDEEDDEDDEDNMMVAANNVAVSSDSSAQQKSLSDN